MSQKKRCRVLVVDDDLATRKLERLLLSRKNFRVFEAENGKAAFELLASNTIDLLVTDIDMPEMDGIELVRTVRNNPLTSYMPVIVCTSSSDLDHVRQSMSFGINGYVLKPLVAGSFIAKVVKAERQVVPVLDDPMRRIYDLGLKKHEFQNLVRVMAVDARQRLKELGRSVEAGELSDFDKFSRDLSCTADSFGARALQTVALEANHRMPEAGMQLRSAYMFSLRTQLDRVHHAALEL